MRRFLSDHPHFPPLLLPHSLFLNEHVSIIQLLELPCPSVGNKNLPHHRYMQNRYLHSSWSRYKVKDHTFLIFVCTLPFYALSLPFYHLPIMVIVSTANAAANFISLCHNCFKPYVLSTECCKQWRTRTVIDDFFGEFPVDREVCHLLKISKC